MEVSQIARAIGKRLGLNLELIEAIALSHDLGHTPFGHTGEEVLDEILEDAGGFEHNRQSYRVVTYLEKRYPEFRGLNLSYETLEGIVKHATPYDHPSNEDLDDIFDLNQIPTMEAQIIDFADEIAYLNHDIDDGLVSNLLKWDELNAVNIWKIKLNETKRKYKTCKNKNIIKFRTISSLISYFINDIIKTTEKNLKKYNIRNFDDLKNINKKVVEFSKEADENRKQLKEFLFEKMYNHPKVMRMRVSAERSIKELFKAYKNYPSIMPVKYQSEIDIIGINRTIADYISSMTDRSALEEYRSLYSGGI
jgi:dGTPase